MEAEAAAVVALPGEVVVNGDGDILWGLVEPLVVTKGCGEGEKAGNKKCDDGEGHIFDLDLVDEYEGKAEF